METHVVTVATRSSVSSAPRIEPLTKDRWGRLIPTCDAICVAASRSICASAPLFGLERLYVRASGMAGTLTLRVMSARGVSRVVFHAASVLTGAGSVSR